MITYPVESLNPMLIFPPVVCVRWTRIHVCINLFKHNNSISSTWFEKKNLCYDLFEKLCSSLHDKHLNKRAMMLLPSEKSYAWITLFASWTCFEYISA